MPFVLRDENTTENPTLATVYGKQITAGKLAYYVYDSGGVATETARKKCILFLGQGEMDGIDRLYYNGEIIPEFNPDNTTERFWKFHPGTKTTRPTYKNITAIANSTTLVLETGHGLIVNDPVAFVAGLDPAVSPWPDGVKQHTKLYIKSVSGDAVTVSATVGGDVISGWATSGTAHTYLLDNLRVYKADSGYFDSVQGRPEFFPDLEFTFSEIAYLEVHLGIVHSHIEDAEPTKFKIFVRGRRLQNYDKNGLVADATGLAYPDQTHLPTQTKFYSANNALVALDIMLNYMNIPMSRINFKSFVKFRDYCDEPISWTSGSSEQFSTPTFNLHPTGITEPFVGTLIAGTIGTNSWVTGATTVQTFDITTTPTVPNKFEAVYTDGHAAMGIGRYIDPTSWIHIMYGWHPAILPSQNKIYVIANGALVDATHAPDVSYGAKLRIEFDSTHVSWYCNDTLVHTESAPSWGGTDPVKGIITFANTASQFTNIKMYPLTASVVPRSINRFDCHIVFPSEVQASSAIEQVFGRAPSCHWQDVNGQIKFVVGSTYKDATSSEFYEDGDRVLSKIISYDPTQSVVRSNIVENSVNFYRKTVDKKQNFLRTEYRDLEDEYYTKKYVYGDRPEIRNYLGYLVDLGIVQIGVANQSLADRMSESILRWNSDLDLFVNLKGTPETFDVAKGDIVKFAHDVPGWTLDEAPEFIVIEETFEEDGTDERSFVLQVYNSDFYQDSSHGAITGNLPSGTPTVLKAPENISYEYDGVRVRFVWDASVTPNVSKYRLTDEFDRLLIETSDLFYIDPNTSATKITRRVRTINTNGEVSSNYATITFIKPPQLAWQDLYNVSVNSGSDKTLSTTASTSGFKHATMKTAVIVGLTDTVLEFQPHVNNVSQGIHLSDYRYGASMWTYSTAVYFNADGTFGETAGSNAFGTYQAGDRFQIVLKVGEYSPKLYKIDSSGLKVLIYNFLTVLKGLCYVRAFQYTSGSTPSTVIDLSPKLSGNLVGDYNYIPTTSDITHLDYATYNASTGDLTPTASTGWSSGIRIGSIPADRDGGFYFKAFGGTLFPTPNGVTVGLTSSYSGHTPSSIPFRIEINHAGELLYYNGSTLIHTESAPCDSFSGLLGGVSEHLFIGRRTTISGAKELYVTVDDYETWSYPAPLSLDNEELFFEVAYNGSLTTRNIVEIRRVSPYTTLLTPEGSPVTVVALLKDNATVGVNKIYDIPKFNLTTPTVGQMLKFNSSSELINFDFGTGTPISGGLADSVLYLDGSSLLSTSNRFKFDGTDLFIINPTPSTVLAQSKTSPYLTLTGHGWDTAGSVDTETKVRFQVVPTSRIGTGTACAKLTFDCYPSEGSLTWGPTFAYGVDSVSDLNTRISLRSPIYSGWGGDLVISYDGVFMFKDSSDVLAGLRPGYISWNGSSSYKHIAYNTYGYGTTITSFFGAPLVFTSLYGASTVRQEYDASNYLKVDVFSDGVVNFTANGTNPSIRMSSDIHMDATLSPYIRAIDFVTNSFTYPSARIKNFPGSTYGGGLKFYTQPPGASTNALVEALKIDEDQSSTFGARVKVVTKMDKFTSSVLIQPDFNLNYYSSTDHHALLIDGYTGGMSGYGLYTFPNKSLIKVINDTNFVSFLLDSAGNSTFNNDSTNASKTFSLKVTSDHSTAHYAPQQFDTLRVTALSPQTHGYYSTGQVRFLRVDDGTDELLEVWRNKNVYVASGSFGVGIAGNGTVSAKIHAISTTEQLRLGYDTSNYFKLTVGASGVATFDMVGASALFNFADPVTMRRQMRNFQVSTATTLTPEIDTYDTFFISALSTAVTIQNHSSSTMHDGDQIRIRLLDNGTPRAITFGTNYVAKAGVSLPTVTVANKHMEMVFTWYADISKYVLMAVALEDYAYSLSAGDHITGGGANRVLYEDGSSNLTTNSKFIFDGLTLSIQAQNSSQTADIFQVIRYDNASAFRVDDDTSVTIGGVYDYVNSKHAAKHTFNFTDGIEFRNVSTGNYAQIRVIGGPQFYFTDTSGSPVPLTLGTRSNPGDGSTFVAAYHLWYFPDSTSQLSVGSTNSVGQVNATSTSLPQYVAYYDTSNYFKTTVSSTGVVTFDAVGAGSSFSFSDNVGIGTLTPSDALNVNSAVSSVYRGNVALYDTTTIATGVGGQIVFGGKYTGTTLTEWASIQGAKLNSTDGDFAGTLHFRTRANGAAMATKAILNDLGNFGIGASTISARLHVISTTEQFRVGYDTSNYLKVVVSSVGLATISTVGTSNGVLFNSQVTINANIDLSDGTIVGISDVGGAQFGDASALIGFFGATPIGQPTNTVALDDVLVNLGFRASGGTNNFTRAISARINPRIASSASSATPTPNCDTTDEFILTALAVAATFGAPTGTPVQGQKLMIRIKDDGTARALGWNAIYRAIGVTLPTTTVISKTLYVGCIYNSSDSKWDVVSVAQEA